MYSESSKGPLFDYVFTVNRQGTILSGKGHYGVEGVQDKMAEGTIGKSVHAAFSQGFSEELMEVLGQGNLGEEKVWSSIPLFSDFPMLYSVRGMPISNGDGDWFFLLMVKGVGERLRKGKRQNEVLFQLLFEYAPIGVALFDEKAKLFKVNPAYCNMLGYSPQELLGNLSFEDYTHPEDVPIVWEALQKLLKREISSFEIEKRHKKKDGTIMWDHLSLSIVFNDQDEFDYGIALVQDIHARKTAEEGLGKVNNQLTNLIQAAHQVAIFATDQKGTLTLFNQGAELMLGYGDMEVVGKHTPLVFHDQSELRQILTGGTDVANGDDFSRLIERTIGSGNTMGEWKYVKKDGTVFPVELSLSPIQNSEGIQDGYLGIALDISKRKQSEQWLRTVIDLIPHLIFAKDIRGKFILANETTARLMGLTQEAIVGKSDDDFNPHPEQTNAYRADELKALATGERIFIPEETLTDHEGHDHIMQTIKMPVQFPGFSEPVIVGVAVDITPQKNAEEEVRFQHKQLEAISQAQKSFISESNTNKTFDELLVNLLNLTGSEYGFIGEALFTAEGSPYLKTYAITNIAWNDETKAFYEKHAPSGLEFLNLNTLFGAVLLDRKPLIANDPAHHPRRGGIPKGHPPLKAFMGIPFLSDQKLVGMVGLANRPGGYNEALMERIQPILSTISQLIEAKRLNAIQKEQEERILTIGKNVPGMIYTLRMRADGTFHLPYVSEGIQDIFGVTVEEVKADASPVFSKVHPDDLQVVMDSVKHSSQHLNQWNREFRIVSTAGQVRWVEGNSTPKQHQDGSINWFGFIQDITERKNTEQALRQSRERLEYLMASNPAVIYTRAPHGDCPLVYISQTVKGKYGYFPSQFTEQPGFWASKVHPKDVSLVEAQFSTVLLEGKLTLEYRFLHQDGRYRWVRDELMLIQDEEGRPMELVGTWVDVTENKQTEEAIRYSEEKFRGITTAALDAIILMDEEGKISLWNKAAEKIFGYSLEEAVGKDLHVLLTHERYQKAFRSGFASFKETGKGPIVGVARELEAIRKGGEKFPVELSVSSIWMNNQWNAVGFIRDITERKQAEQELKNSKEAAEEANRVKSEFLANISHEIRTPMNSILGFSEILLNQAKDKVTKDYLNNIHVNGKLLLGLINEVLDLSKIEAGKMELMAAPVDIRELLGDVKNMFSTQLEKKSLNFEVVISPDFPHSLVLDEIRLRQILVNLVGNAVKFTLHGKIMVTVSVLQKYPDSHHCRIEIKVSDTGIGIDQEDQAVVFESFKQLHKGDTKQFGGTGLGLSITRKLVEMMGGTIVLESEKGKGAVFTVDLDHVECVEQSLSAPRALRETTQTLVFKDPLVLVVDDLESNLIVMRVYLETYNIRVITALSGDEGIEKAKEMKPDLIFMDLRMPGTNGRQAAEALKNFEGTRTVPIIVFTASPSEVDIDALKNIFIGMMVKPVQETDLLHWLKKCLPYETIPLARHDKDRDKAMPLSMDKVTLSRHIEYLRDHFGAQAILLAQVLDLETMDKFIAGLAQYATEHDLAFLSDYVDKLGYLYNSYEIDGLSQHLSRFSEVLEEEKNINRGL